jgi:hypothetical protein
VESDRTSRSQVRRRFVLEPERQPRHSVRSRPVDARHRRSLRFAADMVHRHAPGRRCHRLNGQGVGSARTAARCPTCRSTARLWHCCGMSEPEKVQDTAADAAVDPKEAMRQALEAKKNAQHKQDETSGGPRSLGGTHAKAAGKRQFRRKSGG